MRAKLLSEFLGTFFLVFAGTGAIIFNAATGGSITHVGIALTFGLVVMAMIYAFGDVSGAHFNPAVTLGFATRGLFPWSGVPPYVAAQIAGAFAGSLLLRVLAPDSTTLGETKPLGAAWRSCVLEGVLTFMLMTVVLAVSTGSKEKGLMAGIAVGGVIAFEALFAGPISGASMNPARSLAPATVIGNVQHLWVYVAGPVAGAVLASLVHPLWHPGVAPRAGASDGR